MSRVRDFALTHLNSSSKLPFYGYLKRRKLTAVHIDLSHLLINKSVFGTGYQNLAARETIL